MITTLPLNEIEKYADNIYEAIIVLAKRARQINMQQKQSLFQDQDYDNYDEYEEDEIEINPEDTNYIRLPKPTILALEEFLSGQIDYNYQESTDEDNEEA
ncbi:MAG: DNA-directed RNA polymerase subunit omega [bacterium]